MKTYEPTQKGMRALIKLIQYTDRLARFKAHDPETYMKLVQNCTILGAVFGSFWTLWVFFIISLFVWLV